MLAATFDKASTNRRFVKLHDLKDSTLYKVLNPHASDGRHLFGFF
jgi:hypothetical protein